MSRKLKNVKLDTTQSSHSMNPCVAMLPRSKKELNPLHFFSIFCNSVLFNPSYNSASYGNPLLRIAVSIWALPVTGGGVFEGLRQWFVALFHIHMGISCSRGGHNACQDSLCSFCSFWQCQETNEKLCPKKEYISKEGFHFLCNSNPIKKVREYYEAKSYRLQSMHVCIF